MKKLKYIIVLVILIIISIVTILLILKKNVNEDEYEDLGIIVPDNSDEIKDPAQKEIEIDKKIKYVNSADDYFTVKSMVDNYINLLGNKDIDKLKNILSPSYMEQYKIKNNNILNIDNITKLDNKEQLYKTVVLKMKQCQVNNSIYIYIVNGKGRILGKEGTFTYNLMIEVDVSKNLYYVYPYNFIKNNGYDKLNIGDTINFKIEEIDNKKDNNFTYSEKTDKDMINEYFNNFIELINYYTDFAYNKLDSAYIKKRFGNKENFYSYINANRELYRSIVLREYKVVDNTEYIYVDNYRNTYRFINHEGILNYKVFLDNYTIMTNQEIEKYNKLDRSDKAKYNINKFIKMLNMKDYNAIYNSLNTAFKNNKFKTFNEFKKYINSNFYDINNIEIKEISDSKEYFVYKCVLRGIRRREENKNITIIIKLKEGTDFEMSINIE